MYSSGPSGLFNAPVTKVLLFGSFAVNLSVSYMIKKGGADKVAQSLGNGIQSFICNQFLYNNLPEMLFGVMFIYSFRLFERVMGSSKYALFYFTTTGISSLIQLAINVLTNSNGKLLKSSPFSFIFSCLVLYYKDVPSTMWFKLFKIPLSDKMITYGLAAQTLLGFPSNINSSLIGVASGVIASSRVLGLPNISLPRGVNSLFSKLFLPLLQSAPPTTSYRSTLERNQRQRQAAMGADNPLYAFQQQLQQLQQQQQQQIIPPTPPSEENIQILENMGFPRSRAIEVLTRTNNNINEAASII
ncbi:hypothetical protein RB653_008267 [Dictyostelium firmibasis]|uniref:UBA domain-containing protein n=1 Tax=Dictyostelium firmibasis TaxID=79012 RepID=A0AAN7U4I2_9MYCE